MPAIRSRLPWIPLLLLLALLWAEYSAVRRATRQLPDLARLSGQVGEAGVLRGSDHPARYRVEFTLSGQAGHFEVKTGEDAAVARALQAQLPAGRPAVVYVEPSAATDRHAYNVTSVYQLEASGAVLRPLADEQRAAWHTAGITLVVLCIVVALGVLFVRLTRRPSDSPPAA